MTKAEKRDLKIEFNERNLLLVLCKKICTAMIVLTIICVIGAIIANSYDDKVFSPAFQQTGGYVFVDYFFTKLLGGVFGGWNSKFYVITFILMFILIVLRIILNTLFNIKWKNFIAEKTNPAPAAATVQAAPAVNRYAEQRTDPVVPVHKAAPVAKPSAPFVSEPVPSEPANAASEPDQPSAPEQ